MGNVVYNDRFGYKSLKSETKKDGIRFYEDNTSNKVPSVTTILDYNKDKTFLIEWRKKVGNKEAKNITKESSDVGTFMHQNIENWLKDKPFENGKAFTKKLGIKLAKKIIDEKLCDLNEFWGTEVNLCYDGLYAGTTDLIGIYRNKEAIIDFKNTRKPKKDEWITDYYKQLCAYALAHNEMFGTDIKYGIILMASKDDPYQGVLQEFELSDKFEHYSYLWYKDVEKYYKNH